MNKDLRSLYNSIFKEYPDVLNVEQVSSILDVSKKTVYKIIKDGSLAYLKVGREIRVPKYFLMQYLNIVEK